ncbi:MAG: NAD(+)/NADH kinase, partial [Oscillospiraceae bacterium]
MKFVIIKNQSKDFADEYAILVKKKLEHLDQTAIIFDESQNLYEQFFNCDMIISIGGDGTIIKAFKTSMDYDIPILGFNLGRLGFLANLERTEINRLESIVKGDYTVENRMLLNVNCIIDGKTFCKTAVNDVVISKDSFSKMIDFEVFANDKHFVSYRADGLIISTPTGSTAYSMSAGGPITDPLIECMLLTPICPLSMRSQTTIFSNDCKIDVIATCRQGSNS